MWIFASGSLQANLRPPMNFPSPCYLGAADASHPPGWKQKAEGDSGITGSSAPSLVKFNKGGGRGGEDKVGGRLDPT